ncbi:hypothetical protein QAD02_017490 [Eretmocerus hayati]|uniref:Uncharacterized protein n=1 Tax=Eretmocerus hayati TaxID=131215 RepID=A0ACC2PE07_9HYME|nr:hypothetical protein QAD02_017490 [Eretmocerus hayati]
MEGETNQTTFDVSVYFVLPSKYKTEDDCNDDMVDCFTKCHEFGVSPKWIPEKKCLKMKLDKKDVLVMEEFKGEAFEKLKSSNCVIVGPRCLLSCFVTGEPIPEGTAPVFNVAMRGLIVSASGFSVSTKAEIQKLVEYMGGIYTKELRKSVNYLVTDFVMSAKYERAVGLGIKIVTIDWVKSVWETNLTETIPATDSQFEKHKCPVFFNLVVTTTNLSKRQKEEVRKLISDNGGEFMGVLDGGKVRVVITSESSGASEKLKFAMQNKIPCLKVEWVYDSIRAESSLPFSDYLIEATQACSTPEKSEGQIPLNFSTISMIPGDNQHLCVDETLASATTMSSTIMSATMSDQAFTAPKSNYTAVMDRLSLVDAKKAGPFLDGCNVYLTGFSSNHRDKLNRILTYGSATRMDEISDALTHVIVGDQTKASQDLRMIRSKNLYPYTLKVEWLEESIKLQAPALEENFKVSVNNLAHQNAPEPPSPLSKKNLQLLQRPKIPPAPLFDGRKTNNEPEHDEPTDIVQQYLQETTSDSNSSLREILKLPSSDDLKRGGTPTNSQTSSKRWDNISKVDTRITFNEETRDDSAIPVSQETTSTQRVLKGLIFVVSGFESAEMNQIIAQIHGMGGKIVGKNYTGIPDYGVVPRLGAELRHTVGEIVTELFIEDCIDNERLVDLEYYHKPIMIPKNTKPLVNCVIGMSTYNGAERTYLSCLSEILGARYQDTFSRKTNPLKNTFGSTHLVCPLPTGEKYNAAVKWGLPAVTAQWLLECASEMKRVNEEPYIVGETTVPERIDTTLTDSKVARKDSEPMKPPQEPTPKQNNLASSEKLVGEGSETPVINKRLNSLINDKTPQTSPFHISTPETPYGALFKDNPSPRTRKGWMKWIDHLPDMQQEEPPTKRRKSTPMSEVKRMAWDFVTGRSDNDKPSQNKNKDATISDEKESDEGISSHVTTNRRLSFSDENSPSKTPKNPLISAQIAQLDEILQKASSTPDRQTLSAEHTNQYHLEPAITGRGIVKDSQPESVGWEHPTRKTPSSRQVRNKVIKSYAKIPITCNILTFNSAALLQTGKSEKRKPKFMLSGLRDKGIAEKVILDLGGEVSTGSAFDNSATHLICMKPSRNEKILSSIAAGKWVLHYRYIEACDNEKRFVNEFELGNPKSKGVIPDPENESENAIMKAVYRWRQKLLKDPGGAFRHIVALLITPKEKKEQFERLICAGGGMVIDAKPPYNNSPKGKKITHCFIQLKQIDQQVDWAMMASKGILCFPPNFLNDHLMAESPLNPRDCVMPEFKKYLALLPKQS